jgi:SHS2 domain-containing protein
MVGGFALLEHTADIGISACGDSLEETLSWLAMGMFSLIVDPHSVVPTRGQVVSVASRDRELLVVDWLNELLYQFEATGFLIKDCQISLDQGGTRLEAFCRGEQSDPGRHHILTVVKAATYHGLSVSHGRQWHVRVILDV